MKDNTHSFADSSELKLKYAPLEAILSLATLIGRVHRSLMATANWQVNSGRVTQFLRVCLAAG